MRTKTEQIQNIIDALIEFNEEICLMEWKDDEWVKPSISIDEAIAGLEKILEDKA